MRVGKTQADAAQAVGCSKSKINYLESGRNQQQPEEVRRLLAFYSADPAHIERLVTLTERADQQSWWAPFSDIVPKWLKTFVGLEALAQSEFVYEPLLLPGLVQTPDYAAALLINNLRVAPAGADRVVKLRMARQARLSGNEPLQYHAVIEEPVLNRLVGGPNVMRAQLRHLLKLMEQDNIVLQVMPSCVAVHDGLDGEFTLLTFAEALSIGYVEFPAGAVYVQDQDQVALHSKAADRLSSVALSPTDTAEMIRTYLDALP
ncbi:Helix-turn-helix domain-containing protein [Streptoalloteichus hindustanus]|uniref:Helix-turn-helix domain-containing protein n=1 Tax=Streptoalloteichus hindustanus TaxID=2017 RepID=A0A1M5LFI5_STRHI|nr:Helix-turn-helix domain-containing protein [Streptoalloteichus hindustanus]